MSEPIPTKKYDFSKPDENDGFTKIESHEDYEKYKKGTKREKEQIEKEEEERMRQEIDKLKPKDFSELPLSNANELAGYLEKKNFLEQKAILEKAAEESRISPDNFIALYDCGKEGQTKVSVIENISIVPNLSETEKTKVLEFLFKIKFDPEDGTMDFHEEFEFSTKDKPGAEYLARYFNYHYETAGSEGWNIFNGARVDSLLRFGGEGEKKVLAIFEDTLFRKGEMEYEEALFSHYLLEKLGKNGSDKTYNFVLEKLIENDFPGWEYRELFIKFLKSNAEKAEEIIFKSILGGANKTEAAKNIAIIGAEAMGTEAFRDKINALLIEKKLKEAPGAVNNLEYARSFITPNDNKEAILNLQTFYQEKIKFEEYKVNEKMNDREVALLKSLIGKDEKVLEMGCGAGRLIAELAKDGYDISGYDFTKRHADITKKEIEKLGLEASVFQGDWHNNAIKDESLNAVYSFGRNILHDYSIVDQAQLFREACRILKPGGRFIFDIPNREKGGYKKMADEYKDEMERRGIRNFRYGSIYDSPDGKHFATRYAYSNEDIEELARLTGFRILKVERLPLETGQDDENWYYVLEKV